MTENIIWICVLACIVCPVLALASIIFSNHNTNRHIRSTEAQFLKIYRRSEERIDRTNEMVCKLSSCVDKTENLLITITNEYEHRMDKLQANHDKVMEQNSDLAKQNTVLSSAATAPHINIANGTNNQ